MGGRHVALTFHEQEDPSTDSPEPSVRQAGQSLCELFRVGLEEIRTRKAFLNFTEQDETNLAKIGDLLEREAEGVIDDFYEHLKRFEPLRRFLRDDQSIAYLKQTQKQYLHTLGRLWDRSEYFENRLRIGMTHEQVGLDQKWCLGGYAVMFEIISRRIVRQYADRPQEAAGLMVTLQKILSLDSSLMVETYYRATVQRLEATLQELGDTQRRLEEHSRLDSLTRVYNRKYLMESLEMELCRSQRYGHPFTLLLLDVDYFKEINDRYGHVVGDFVLQEIIRLARSVLRPTDILGRYGGEEFIVGLVENGLAPGQRVAERIRLKIALTPLEYEKHRLSVTVSIGVATKQSDDESIESLIRRADQAMYRAKTVGRNRVCLSAA